MRCETEKKYDLGFSGGSEVVDGLIFDGHTGKRIGNGKRGIHINEETVDFLFQLLHHGNNVKRVYDLECLGGNKICPNPFDLIRGVFHIRVTVKGLFLLISPRIQHIAVVLVGFGTSHTVVALHLFEQCLHQRDTIVFHLNGGGDSVFLTVNRNPGFCV